MEVVWKFFVGGTVTSVEEVHVSIIEGAPFFYWHCAESESAASSGYESDCPGTRVRVIYRGEGTAESADWTAAFPDGIRQGRADIPLTNQEGSEGLRFCADKGEFLSFTLQNRSTSGSVRCVIEVDGGIIASNESSGAYKIASCDGSA